MKWFIIAVGGIVGVAHIGILGHLIKPQQSIHSSPTINLPKGPYSSYKIKAGKDGYEIEYRANDPKVLSSERSMNLDRNKKAVANNSNRLFVIGTRTLNDEMANHTD